MTSMKQIEANRRNSQKSTGPKTVHGKQNVGTNALKHGLRAETIVISGEDPEEFEALREGLRAHLQPIGPLEDHYVERIAMCLWKLGRIETLEAATMRCHQFKVEAERAEERVRALERPSLENHVHGGDYGRRPLGGYPGEEETALDPEVYERAIEERNARKAALEALDPTMAIAFQNANWALEKLLRYRTEAERSLQSYISDLQALQAARRAKIDGPKNVIDVESDEPTNVEGSPRKSRSRVPRVRLNEDTESG